MVLPIVKINTQMGTFYRHLLLALILSSEPAILNLCLWTSDGNGTENEYDFLSSFTNYNPIVILKFESLSDASFHYLNR